MIDDKKDRARLAGGSRKGKSEPTKKTPQPSRAAEREDKASLTGRIVRHVLKDFIAAPPPDAAGGLYHVTARDGRRHAGKHAIEDGAYQVEGSNWVLIFRNGHFAEAMSIERKKFLPKAITPVALS